jgi:hypothetical protein
MFRSLGLATEVLWEKPTHEKGIVGHDVRGRMTRGEPWEHLVPRAVAALLKQWDLPQRLRELSESHA